MDEHPPQDEGQPEQTGEAIEQPDQPFPLVGIGASAGGLQALQQFFTHMPPDSGMAFVVILHLSPIHESNAAAVLQHTTYMPVLQVTEAVQVIPNHVYVIPPTSDLSMADGTIRNRPLAHITHQLTYDQLTADAAQVLQTLAKVEREVQSTDGRSYLARMVPYRTLEDKIDGVTLTFVDITDRK